MRARAAGVSCEIIDTYLTFNLEPAAALPDLHKAGPDGVSTVTEQSTIISAVPMRALAPRSA